MNTGVTDICKKNYLIFIAKKHVFWLVLGQFFSLQKIKLMLHFDKKLRPVSNLFYEIFIYKTRVIYKNFTLDSAP